MSRLGIMASQISGHLSTNAYESIQTVTLSSSQSSISFTSIPSTYKHLQIRMITRCSRTDYTVAALFMRFNSDSGTNYSGHYLGGDGSSIFTYGGANYTFAPGGLASGANSGANIFSGCILDILDYANTNKYKTSRALSGFDRNASGGELNLQSGNWRNNNAITSITLTAETGANFLQYSQVALYGIRG